MSYCDTCEHLMANKNVCPYWDENTAPLPDGWTCTWRDIGLMEAAKQWQKACNMPEDERACIRELVTLISEGKR